MRPHLPSHLILAAVALGGCPSGILYTGGDSSCEEGHCGRDADVDGLDDLCEVVICSEGQDCVDGRCQSMNLCDGVRCNNAGEVCDPRDGLCHVGAADDDSDGYTLLAGDCDDGDGAIHPGAVELCDGVDQDCDLEVDEEVDPPQCETGCGLGVQRCEGGRWGECSMPLEGECALGDESEQACGLCGIQRRTCGEGCLWGAFSDCEGEGECVPSSFSLCTTGCGSEGNRSCDELCAWGACTPPAESCNGVDDDCDGQCDEGCRLAVHRSSCASDHFYSASESEAACCGCTIEFLNYFYLASATAPGLTAFYRCYSASSSDHMYTTSSTCEGATQFVLEGTLGFIAGSAGLCGATPLYRLSNGGLGDHFYTTSAFERDTAIANGWADEGVAGYVWTSP